MVVRSIKEIYKYFLSSKGVETDTRKGVKNKLFIALKGENHNGNSYAIEALEKGAAFAIVDEDIDYQDDRIIRVDDGLKLLQDLAQYHRKELRIPVLAITGSNGKTTTKELLAAVLSQKFQIHFTQGNYNNHIGVPLTILQADQSIELLILEMGASAIGDIKELCEIGLPDFGLITNIGQAHLEGFGSLEGVKKGKSELYDHLSSFSGKAFINLNENHLKNLSQHVEDRLFYSDISNKNVKGINKPDTLFFDPLTYSPEIKLNYLRDKKETLLYTSPLYGIYNYQNIITAITVGIHFKVNLPKIKEAVRNYLPSNNRSEIRKYEDFSVVMDAYNANPTSMKLSIESFKAMDGENKILILGSMKELGEFSKPEHSKLLEYIFSCRENFKGIYLIGEEYWPLKENYKNTSFKFYKTPIELAEMMNSDSVQDSLILLKGSRSNKLESLIDTYNKH